MCLSLAVTEWIRIVHTGWKGKKYDTYLPIALSLTVWASGRVQMAHKNSVMSCRCVGVVICMQQGVHSIVPDYATMISPYLTSVKPRIIYLSVVGLPSFLKNTPLNEKNRQISSSTMSLRYTKHSDHSKTPGNLNTQHVMLCLTTMSCANIQQVRAIWSNVTVQNLLPVLTTVATIIVGTLQIKSNCGVGN